MKENNKIPFTGPNTTWVIQFSRQESPAHPQKAEFLIPYPENKENEPSQWINVTELEEEQDRYEDSLKNLQKLHEELINGCEKSIEKGEESYHQQKEISRSLSDLNAIIKNFEKLLKEILGESEEET